MTYLQLEAFLFRSRFMLFFPFLAHNIYASHILNTNDEHIQSITIESITLASIDRASVNEAPAVAVTARGW